MNIWKGYPVINLSAEEKLQAALDQLAMNFLMSFCPVSLNLK